MKKNIYFGKFIVFEGLDGSGQSTQVKFLSDFLKSEMNLNVLSTKEPTNLEVGQFIRDVLNRKYKVSPDALQLLFSADRADHLAKRIIPALERGEWVIGDRYAFSTFAFGSIDYCPLDWLMQINDFFLAPDLVFLLNVRPEICLERIDSSRDKREFFEEKEKLERAWLGYEKVLATNLFNIIVIDGEKSVEEIAKEIRGHVIKNLSGK